MEKLAMKQYAQNIAKVMHIFNSFYYTDVGYNDYIYLKGKEIIEYFIDQLKEEGITYVPSWKDPQEGSSEEEK